MRRDRDQAPFLVLEMAREDKQGRKARLSLVLCNDTKAKQVNWRAIKYFNAMLLRQHL
jgi:hypothetical protein